jgi:large subunit ribosomal protein L18
MKKILNLSRSSKSEKKLFRLSVFRSSKHIYAQLIDDVANKTVASASTLEFREKDQKKRYYANLDLADKVGNSIAERGVKVGVTHVVFDRGNKRYHGIVKKIADSARTKLKF